MSRSELRDRDPRGPLHLGAAALTAAALLLAALPGRAAPAGEPEEDREVRRERVVVLSKEGGPGERVLMSRLLGGGYLGVELLPLTSELRSHFGVPEDRGVMVARVLEGGPAAEAGLRVGDVVTAVEAEAVATPWDLSVAVRGKEAGDRVTLEVWRDRRALELAVTVKERERQRVDLGRLLELGEGPHGIRWREHHGRRLVAPTLFFEPEVVERLGESLEKIDWPRLSRSLGERNQELERRLAELEKRLQELERELRRQ